MKRFLNGLGIFGSIILTIILSFLIFFYVIILNAKFILSDNGIATTLKKVDIATTLKTTDDGVMWEDFKQLAEELNLSEEQFEQILNSDEVKEQVGGYLSEVISSSLNDKSVNLTKEEIDNFLNIAVDEYNKVSDTPISEAQKQTIINSFDEAMITNMNEELGNINLTNTVDPAYEDYLQITNNILFGNYTLILLGMIILIIGLIILFRFSCYKWMRYVKISTITNGVLMLIIGLFAIIIPLYNLEMIIPLKKTIVTNIFITSGILFIISIGLAIIQKYLKKYVESKKEKKEIEINE